MVERSRRCSDRFCGRYKPYQRNKAAGSDDLYYALFKVFDDALTKLMSLR